MTLELYIAGPVLGLLVATVYWIGRSAARRRRVADDEVREVVESAAGQAFAQRLREVFGRRGLTDAERRVLPWPPPPPLPIEVIRLRAAKMAGDLRFNGDSHAARIVNDALVVGDRDVLLALLQEEKAQP